VQISLSHCRNSIRCLSVAISVLAVALLACASLSAQDSAAQDTVKVLDPAPVVPQQAQSYVSITPKQRLIWFVRSTGGVESLLLAGPISAGWGTAFHHPPEYNTSWEGFGQRYGMRLTGVSTGNAMEATLGAIWGEDPRYFRTEGQPFKKRVVNIVDLTFRAYRDDGQRHIAYARLAGNVGNNFLSNTWRVPSQDTWQNSSIRVLEGIGGKAVGNAAYEFFPQLFKWLRGNH
jgi:hypothetical protein